MASLLEMSFISIPSNDVKKRQQWCYNATNQPSRSTSTSSLQHGRPVHHRGGNTTRHVSAPGQRWQHPHQHLEHKTATSFLSVRDSNTLSASRPESLRRPRGGGGGGGESPLKFHFFFVLKICCSEHSESKALSTRNPRGPLRVDSTLFTFWKRMQKQLISSCLA